MSKLTGKERDKIIKDKLAEYKKKLKVFHMRWTPGDLLDDKVLKSTPAFWYMRFGWSRQEIEGLFYAAEIYIDRVFESALDAVFGPDGKGPRWRPPEMQEEVRGKWNRRGYYKTKPWWKVKQLGDINQRQQGSKNYKNEPYAYDKEWRLKNKDYEANDETYGSQGGKGKNGKGGNWSNSKDAQSMNRQGRRRSILNQKLHPNAEKIWQKASNYGGKNEKINWKQFKDGLNAHNIEIDEDTAKKLFDVYADKDGLMNYSQFEELLKKLDNTQVKPGVDIGDITMKDLGDNFQTILLMKRVLLAASMDVPFNVTDFLSGNITGNIGSPGLLLGKLATRDADWNERLKIMDNIANNLGTNPEYDRFLEPAHASDLLMGWTAQMLDTKPAVSKTAVDQLPTVFHEIADKSHPDVAMSHLDDVVDGLFNVIDNKKHEANHDAAKQALRDIVDDVVANRDAEAVLYLAGLLGEKTDIENCTDPDARKAALDNIKRIMGDPDSPLNDKNKNNPNNNKNNPNSKKNDNKGNPNNDATPNNKEWLDTGTGNREGPSDALMEQGHNDNPNNPGKYKVNPITDEDLIDDYNSNMKGKKGARQQKSGAKGGDMKGGNWGGNKESYGSGPRGDRFGGKPEEYEDDDTKPTTYGGTDVVDRPMSEYGSEPDDPNRRKGKERDMTLKFGKSPNTDANGQDDPNDGTISPNYPVKYDVAKGTGGGGKNGGGNNDNNPEDYDDFDHIDFDGKAYDPKNVPRQKTNPIKPKRQKGKEKELSLKFGRWGNRDAPQDGINDPPMHSNEVYDSDPRSGSQKHKPIIGPQGKNGPNMGKNGTGDKGKGPNNKLGVDDDPEEDLGDIDDPNDPGDKGGKRGGTKRKGTNGKGDFDGKFGDDDKKNSPYGGNKRPLSNEEVKSKKGDYNQKPKNKNNDKLGNDNKNNGNNNNKPNYGDDEKKEGPLSSKEIGDEFRNVVSDAVSNAIHDPNKRNKENGAKLADKLDELSPNNFVNTLDGDAKNKFLNWKRGPTKPYNKKLPFPNKPLPRIKAGTAQTHTVSGAREVTIKPPTMPDI